MSAPRRYLPLAVLAMALAAAPLSACGGSPPPQTTASAYLTDWSRQDWAAMRQLTSNPPADFTAVNQAAFTNLSVRQASITAGTVKTNGPAASAPITERLTLAGLGTITLSSRLHLVQHDGKWLVQWSPATIAPQLRTGDQLSLRTTWPARAAILGAAGAPLTTQGQVVTIGVEGARVKNAAALTSALVAAGATKQEASSAIAAAKAHPTFFEPVFTVSRARYDQLQPTIYPIPGTVFQSGNALSAITPGLTAGLVGTVGPVTARNSASSARRTTRRACRPGLGAGRGASAGRHSWRHRHRRQRRRRKHRDAGDAACPSGHPGHHHDQPVDAAGGRGRAVR